MKLPKGEYNTSKIHYRTNIECEKARVKLTEKEKTDLKIRYQKFKERVSNNFINISKSVSVKLNPYLPDVVKPLIIPSTKSSHGVPL